MTKSLGEKPELRWVKITELYIDPAYQRSAKSDASRKNLAYLQEHFSWENCGALIVCWMPDKRQYAVVDGQHRLLAALSRNDIPELPCVVVKGQDAHGQAKSFMVVNTRRVKLNTLAAYHAAVAADDPDAVSIQGILNECGMDVPRNPIPKGATDARQIQCVGTLAKLIGTYSRKQIVWALTVIPEAYGDEKGQMRASLVKALAEFIKQRADADRARMVEVLQGLDPEEFETSARAYMAIEGGTAKTAMTATLERLYKNAGRGRVA